MQGGVALAEIQILIALTMNPSEHRVIDSSPILFNGVNQIFDNFVISHLPLPLSQIAIHVVPGHEIVLIIDAVLF